MSNRRRKLLIDVERQRRFIMAWVLIAIILVNLLFLVTLGLEPTLLAAIDPIDTIPLVGVEIAVVGLMAYLGLIISHRIVGPCYALMRDLDKVAAGDLTVRTRLRQGDFSIDVGHSLRATTVRLCDHIGEIKKTAAALAALPGKSDEFYRLTETLAQQLSHFKTDAEPLVTDASPGDEAVEPPRQGAAGGG